MKYILSIIVVIITYIIISNVVVANNLIPDDAIRVRVIANSNSDYDQKIKYEVKDIVEDDMYNIMSKTTSIENARDEINNNIPTLSKDIYKYLK